MDAEQDCANFGVDRFPLFADSASPYAYFGMTPTLFDAPSTASRSPMQWTAHSFLAATPWYPLTRQVVPLLGFAWGFTIDEHSAIALHSLARLSASDWTSHISLLRASCPSWMFDAGSHLDAQ